MLLPQRSGPGEHPTQAQLQAEPSHPAPPHGAPSSPCTLPTPGCCVHHGHPPAGSQPMLLPTSSLACETHLPQRCHSGFQNQASPSMSHSLVRALPWLPLPLTRDPACEALKAWLSAHPPHHHTLPCTDTLISRCSLGHHHRREARYATHICQVSPFRVPRVPGLLHIK